jgi:hypothetical protein
MLVTTPRRPVKVHTEVPAKRPEPKDARPLKERLADPIPGRWALLGMVVLVGANVAAGVLEPAPANPNLPDPWFVTLPTTVAVLAMLGALGGLLARRRWGMALSLVGAGIAVAMVVACPLSGHHHFGLWWVGEIASLTAWATVSFAGLRLSPGPRRSL